MARLGANVQSAGQKRVDHVGHSRSGNNFAAAARCNHLGEQRNLATSVLPIEDNEIKSVSSEHGAKAGVKESKQHLPQKNFILAEPLAKHRH
jgi:hypothetical protein